MHIIAFYDISTCTQKEVSTLNIGDKIDSSGKIHLFLALSDRWITCDKIVKKLREIFHFTEKRLKLFGKEKKHVNKANAIMYIEKGSVKTKALVETVIKF